jgi:hypothetical protein
MLTDLATTNYFQQIAEIGQCDSETEVNELTHIPEKLPYQSAQPQSVPVMGTAGTNWGTVSKVYIYIGTQQYTLGSLPLKA